MVRTRLMLALSAVALASFMAGCTGSSHKSNDQGPASAPEAEFDSATGAIAGQVLTVEFEPVAGASIGLDGAAMSTVSAQDGTFSFSRVPPGDHTLEAVQLGFHPIKMTVSVQANQRTEGVTITLEPLPVPKPRMAVDQFTGYITCSIGTAGAVSEECGQGLQTAVGTFGGNARNKIDWRSNITTVERLRTVYFELTWVPGSAAAKKLGFNVAHGFKCDPDCGASKTYCGVFKNYGPPVQRCEIAGDALGVQKPEKDLPWDITARAWAAPVPATEVPNVVFEQSFTMYRTEFYDMAKPEGYSAVPPQ